MARQRRGFDFSGLYLFFFRVSSANRSPTTVAMHGRCTVLFMYSVVIMLHYIVLTYNLTRRAPVFVHPNTFFGDFHVFGGYYAPLYGTCI